MRLLFNGGIYRSVVLPALARRRDLETSFECWHVMLGDVRVGTISVRPGVLAGADQWGWSCGFYPLSHRGEREDGTAPDFFTARAAFAAAWPRLLPKITEADLAENRRERAMTAWKYRMRESCCRLPTQEPGGPSRCFCGAEIDIDGVGAHVIIAHMDAQP